jgi:hypothetical protein
LFYGLGINRTGTGKKAEIYRIETRKNQQNWYGKKTEINRIGTGNKMEINRIGTKKDGNQQDRDRE